ncbi:MAB_1171c family putative transporter [Streptomyces sp. NPDC059456]|uniref:MAB_1171c family putative transporter n=1 Tax=Streptomyces sp. NPDC059456 TaxID=3346838 RepID=UPI00369015FB
MTTVRAVDVALLCPTVTGTVLMARGALTGGRRERSLWGALFLVTGAVAVGVPGIRRCIENLLGVASVANVLVHLLSLGAAACLIEFIHGTTTADDRRGLSAPVRGLAVACPALVLVFALMPRPDGEEDLLTQTSTGWSLAYWGIVTLYLGWGLLACAVMCFRYMSHAASGALRTSLRLIGAGSLFGLAYEAHRVVYLLGHTAAPGWFAGTAVVATTQVLLASSMLLLVLGVAWPGLAERVRVRRVRTRIRRIRPLWLALREAVPEVMLPLPAALARDADVLLYRYVIEIRDGTLALGAFAGEPAREAARTLLTAQGLSGAALEAAVEAAALRYAARQTVPGGASSGAARPPGAGPAGDDLDAEVAWLELVAEAYATPRVRRVAGELPAGPAPVGEDAP